MADTTSDAMEGLQSNLEPQAETQERGPSEDSMDLSYPEPYPERLDNPQASTTMSVIDPALTAPVADITVTQAQPTPAANGSSNVIPRKRGRPKSTILTSFIPTPRPPRAPATGPKRPVGRPRLDGRPAGSVTVKSTRKRGRPRKGSLGIFQDPGSSRSYTPVSKPRV